MAAQKGKDLLIKVDMDGAGTYETLAGLRATRIAFNAQSIDITNVESTDGWRELLGGAGIKSAALSGSGVFRDTTADDGTVEGAFQLTSLEYAGNHDGEATYEVALASAGGLTFTAA